MAISEENQKKMKALQCKRGDEKYNSGFGRCLIRTSRDSRGTQGKGYEKHLISSRDNIKTVATLKTKKLREKVEGKPVVVICGRTIPQDPDWKKEGVQKPKRFEKKAVVESKKGENGGKRK